MWLVGDVETYLVCDFMLDVYPNKVAEEILDDSPCSFFKLKPN